MPRSPPPERAPTLASKDGGLRGPSAPAIPAPGEQPAARVVWLLQELGWGEQIPPTCSVRSGLLQQGPGLLASPPGEQQAGRRVPPRSVCASQRCCPSHSSWRLTTADTLLRAGQNQCQWGKIKAL